MNDAVILEKLDQLTNEIQSMKLEIKELKTELKNRPEPLELAADESLAELDGDELKKVCKTLLDSVEELRNLMAGVRSGVELTDDLQPVFRQLYPHAVRFCHEFGDDFEFDKLTYLLRKTLSSLDAIEEGVDLLKAGAELRNDLLPVVQIAYPRILKMLTTLHEGEFRAEKLGNLLHTMLLNIHTLSDILNMLSPVTEFLKEFTVIMQQTDMLPNLNKWLDGIQTGNPAMHMLTNSLLALKNIDLNEERMTQISEAIKSVDVNRIEPVSPLGMLGKLRDPRVQEALGFSFMVMQAMGGCLQAWQRTGSGNAESEK